MPGLACTAQRPDPGIDQLRDLGRRGRLVAVLTEVSPEAGRDLRRASYRLIWPLVFQHLTRPLERQKGHARCATSVRSLLPACHDGFSDDVVGVSDYLFHYARRPIENLEGWITSRLAAATIDAYRIRRGALGAQQKVRVPGWLAARLGHERWLVELARRILEWVGVSATAGTGIWPLGAWTDLRVRFTGESQYDSAVVATEIQFVLTTMRTGRPNWYATYVERPLAHKQVPVSFTREPLESTLLFGADRAEREAAHVQELASAALAEIEAGLAEGRPAEEVVRHVLGEVFLGVPGIVTSLELPPSADQDDAERLAGELSDDVRFGRLVAEVLDILADRSAALDD